jgi:hypothetical protein
MEAHPDRRMKYTSAWLPLHYRTAALAALATSFGAGRPSVTVRYLGIF